jgi:hypothetical protein
MSTISVQSRGNSRMSITGLPKERSNELRGDNRSWDSEIQESENLNNKILIARDDYHPDGINNGEICGSSRLDISGCILASLVTGVRATHGIHTGIWNLNDIRSSMNESIYNWQKFHMSR